jgi:hypothetical protein
VRQTGDTPTDRETDTDRHRHRQTEEGPRPDGYGVLVFPDGAEFTGVMKGGKYEGFGVLRYKSKDEYRREGGGGWRGVGAGAGVEDER